MSQMEELLHLSQLISSANDEQLRCFLSLLPESELRKIILGFVHHTMLTLYSRFTQQKYEHIIDANGINETDEPIDSSTSVKNRKNPDLQVFKHQFNEKDETQSIIQNMHRRMAEVGVEEYPTLVCSSSDVDVSPIQNVCDDLWHHIFTFVDITSRHLSKSTCRSWYQWASHPSSIYCLPFSWRVRLVPRLVKGIWKVENFKHVRRLVFCHYSCLRPTDPEHVEIVAKVLDECKQVEIVDLSQSDLYQPIVIPQVLAKLIDSGRLIRNPSRQTKLVMHHGERVYSNTRLSATNIPFITSLQQYFDKIELVDSDPDMTNLSRIVLYDQEVKDMFTRVSWISPTPVTAVSVMLTMRNLRYLRLEWSVICNWFSSNLIASDGRNNGGMWNKLTHITVDVAHVLCPEAQEFHEYHDPDHNMCSRSMVSFLRRAPGVESIKVIQVYRYSLGERPGKKDVLFRVAPLAIKPVGRKHGCNPFAIANLWKLKQLSLEMPQFSARSAPMNKSFTLLIRNLRWSNVVQLDLSISPQCYYGQIRGNEGGDVSAMWWYLKDLVEQGMVHNLMFLKIHVNLEIKLNWKNTPKFLEECLQVISAVSSRLSAKAQVFHFVVENKSPSTSHLVNFHTQSLLIAQIFSNFATLSAGDSCFKELKVVHPFATKQPPEQSRSILHTTFPGVNFHKCGFHWRRTE